MQTVRRLYLYLLSGITLGMLLVGLTLLLEVTLGALGIGVGGLVTGGGGERERLSVAAALIGVGLPVWGIHWYFVERGLGPTNPHAAAERGSVVRALYLTLVLAVLLAFGATAGLTLLQDVIRELFGVSASQFSSANPANAVAVLAVTGVAWFYHAGIRRRDMRLGPLSGAAAWLPRVYLYGAALTGLVTLLFTLAMLVGFVADYWLAPPPDIEEPGFRLYQLAGHLAAILVSLVVWLGHWWYAARLMADTGWRGASERPAYLRVAYFVAVIGIGAAAVIAFLGQAASALLVPILGASDVLGIPSDPEDLARTTIVAILSAVPFAIAWWLHVRWVRAESLQTDGQESAATVDRLDFGLVGLIGLGFGAVGIGWIIGLLIDVLLGGNRTAGDGWRLEMAQYLPYAVTGFAIWAWNWAHLQRRHAADPTGESGSTVRRAYLLIAVAASLVASLVSLALVLYRLFGSLLGVSVGDAAAELSTPLGALLVAGAVAAYHGMAVRRDMALRAAHAPEPQPAAEPAAETQVAAEAVDAADVRRGLTLVGPPNGDLEAAIETLRKQLPDGYRLE
jgi:hypothetical protein